MQKKTLSRREFLRDFTLAATGVIVAACAPKAEPEPTAIQAEATTGAVSEVEATEAPAEEPTPEPAAPADQARKLTWWTFPLGLPPEEWPHGKWEGELAQRYTAEVDPVVTVEVMPLGWESWEKLSTSITAGTPPDLVGRSNDWWLGLAAASCECQVEVELQDDLRNDLPSGWYESMLWRGRNYYVPWFGLAQGPMLNLSIVREAGAEDLLPELPCRSWEIDQWIALLKACTFSRDDGTRAYGIVIPTAFADSAFVWPLRVMMWNYGARALVYDENKGWICPMRDEAGVGWLRLMQELYTVHEVCPDPRGLDFAKQGDYWAANSSAYRLPGAGLQATRGSGVTLDPATLTITTPEGMDTVFVQTPTAPGVEQMTWGGPKGDAVLQPFKTEDPGAIAPTIEFAHWVVNRENQEFLAQYHIPVRKSAVEVMADDPYLAYIFDCWVPYAYLPEGSGCDVQETDIFAEMMQLLYLPTEPELVAEVWASRLEALDCYEV